MTRITLDEQLNIFIVLSTPSSFDEIQRRLSQLNITIDAQAFGSENKNSRAQVSEDQSVHPQNRDVIWSGSLDTNQKPLVVGDGSQGVLVWPLSCFLSQSAEKLALCGTC